MPKPVIPKPVTSTKRAAPSSMSPKIMPPKMSSGPSYDERMSGMKVAAISLFVTLGAIVCLGMVSLFFVARFNGMHDSVNRMDWRDLTSEMQNQRRYVEELKRNSERAVAEKISMTEKISFVEYAIDRQAHEILNPPTSTYTAIAKVQIADCEIDEDGPCGSDLSVYAPANWASTTTSQIFYLAHLEGEDLKWFGPYKDNLQRIVAEAQFVKTIAK